MNLYNCIVLILLASVKASVLIGGFGSPIDPNKPEVKAIYDFIVIQIPSLSSWKIEEVRMQVVSGRNYLFSFSLDKDTAQVKVYQPLDHSLSITLYSINNQQKPIPEFKASESSPPAIIQKQSVSLINALFSQSLPQSKVVPNITEINLLGNFDIKPFILLAPNQIQTKKILGYISAKYPSLSNYEIIQIWKYENLSSVLLIVSRSSSKDQIVIFKIVISLTLNYTVDILQTNSVTGFTLNEISLFRDKCYQQRPSLSQFLISSISNGQTNSTLKFFFIQNNYYYKAYGFYEGGEKKVRFQD